MKRVKKKHGGKRRGSGRKKMDEEDKKKTVILYVVNKDLARIGGEAAFKEKCYALLG